MDAIILAKELTDLRNRRKILEDQVELLKIEYTTKSFEFLRLIEEEGLDKISVDGYTVYPQQEMRASISDEVSAFQWLRDNNCGSIIREAVNNKTLVSTMKQLAESGVIDTSMTDDSIGIKVYVHDVVRVRKS